MKKDNFTDPFAPVDIQPIIVAGEKVPSRIAVRVKGDDGAWSNEPAGILSAGYQLLPNRKIRDVGEDIMSRTPSEYGGFDNLKTLWDGKHYVDYFASRKEITVVKHGSDLNLHLGIMLWNAYDGTRKYGFEIYALNPFCTNQYHSRNRFGFYAWRHNSDSANSIDMDDALESISQGVQNIIAIAPRIGLLKKEPLSSQMIIDARRDTDLPTSYWGHVIDKLEEEEHNKFGLFQAMTNVASHKMNGLSSISTGTSIVDHFLDEETRNVVNHTTAAEVIRSKA